jgi:hypothetical protein
MSTFEWQSAYGGWTLKPVVGVVISSPILCLEVADRGQRRLRIE